MNHSRALTGLTVTLLLVAGLGLPRPATGQASPGDTAGTWPGRYPFTPADVHFVTGMISHHAQALVMSALVPERSASGSIRTLAQRIIASQEDEIWLFQEWLKERDQPVPEVSAGKVKMAMHGMEHDMMMPGMLSDEQLKELEEARGAEFDRLFLTYMIQHHQGALVMVDDLFASPGAGQDDAAFKFASDIYADQSAEIERMQLMLLTIPSR